MGALPSIKPAAQGSPLVLQPPETRLACHQLGALQTSTRCLISSRLMCDHIKVAWGAQLGEDFKEITLTSSATGSRSYLASVVRELLRRYTPPIKSQEYMDANKCIDELLKQLEDERRNVRRQRRSPASMSPSTLRIWGPSIRQEEKEKLLHSSSSLHPCVMTHLSLSAAASPLDGAQNPSGMQAQLLPQPLFNTSTSLTEGNKSSTAECQLQMEQIQIWAHQTERTLVRRWPEAGLTCHSVSAGADGAGLSPCPHLVPHWIGTRRVSGRLGAVAGRWGGVEGGGGHGTQLEILQA
ncbi:unnamed protein product [Pleuronectes platessa]|uniref:Uncharacterized protein n=1 Tax=Pleuronectes platessa TaxID=8262 RepID=A0A9N7VHG2_PLEPL|nr:unnamed protein product [Pleuronectes platessa]